MLTLRTPDVIHNNDEWLLKRNIRPARDTAAVVTGGASGIGAGIVAALAAAGARVYVLDLNRPKSPITNGQVQYFTGNIIEGEDYAKMVGSIIADGVKIDMVVCNAGMAGKAAQGSLLTLDVNAARAVFDVNYWGQVQTIQVLANAEVLATEAVIYTFSSINALRNSPARMEPYATAKDALLRLTDVSILRDLNDPAALNLNISAYALVLTGVDSAMLDGQEGARDYVEKFSKFGVIQPVQVGYAILNLFWSRPTGTVVDLTGGTNDRYQAWSATQES